MNSKLPVIEGGNPIIKSHIPYGKHNIGDEEINLVIETLKSTHLTQGSKVFEFEDKVKEYCGAAYAVAVANGTAALHVACLACGIKEGDEVIVPSFSFAATANCILYCGAKPVFCDVSLSTSNITVDLIKNLVTDRTKAILAVHFAGLPCEMEELRAFTNKKGLILIEDAAHSIGSEYKDNNNNWLKVGSCKHSDVCTFSFHPVKTVAAAEGGMVLCSNKELYEKIRLFANHGITRNRNYMEKDEGSWFYEMKELGFNYRLSDIHSAIGIAQLKKIDAFINKRREIVDLYNKEFKNVKEIELVKEDNNSTKAAWHIIVMKVNEEFLNCSRLHLYNALKKENIGVNVHYIPIHKHPYYIKKVNTHTIELPNTEKLYQQSITLPLYPNLNKRDILNIIKAVKRVIKWYSLKSI